MKYVDSLPQSCRLEAALRYAQLGWMVFPCHATLPSSQGCTCDQANCQAPGKHALFEHGELFATRDEEAIRQWWKHWPGASIGIVTGEASGLMVLDIDAAHGGLDTLHELQSHGEVEFASAVRTPSGGLHLYLQYSSLQAEYGQGITVCSDGAYVIAPPSLHAAFSTWSWIGITKGIKDEPVELIAG